MKGMKRSGYAVMAAALAALMLLIGLNGALASEATAPQKDTAAVDAQGLLTLEEAMAIALEQAKMTEDQVVITALKMDRDDGRDEIEVEFIAGDSEYEYGIDAATGEIIETSIERVGERKLELINGNHITLEEAKAMALAEANLTAEQVTFTELEFDFDDGRAEYEVRFTNGQEEHKLTLDAASGEVLAYKVETQRGGKGR